MIKAEDFYKSLTRNDIDFFTGVPDSLLKSFCAYIKDNVNEHKNIIASNEGNAIGLASGYYLVSKKPALVYMQNSGLGNSINPIASLADELVYNIPMLLVVGWRGEPGIKDEPQHKKQGIITIDLLKVLGIEYEVLDEHNTKEEVDKIIENACSYMMKTNKIFALVIKKGTFDEYKLKDNHENKLKDNDEYKLKDNTVADFELTRERAIEIMLSHMDKKSVVVSTTGMASRELFELREKRNEGHEKDFLTVGSMGHASQIALAISLNKRGQDVYCIDGDGAVIMHMGGLAIIGSQGPENFKHIVINNGAHDSVGGQETAGLKINITGIAESCGYKHVFTCSTEKELVYYSEKIKDMEGPVMLEIKVRKGARKDLGRPTKTPVENKEAFMKFLRES